ncbi:MAG: hypothetical protein LT070_06945 [Solirubrobacteraceae bacterium]|nr:hypothetical protein [Solirubrobacteraceae bacterium]
MALSIVATFATSLWVVLWALGFKSFDGFLVALIIVLVAAGSQILASRLRSVRRD